jgi:hypothetical protein
LEIIRQAAAVEFGQIGQDRGGVFRPEDYRPDVPETDVNRSAVEGIVPFAVTGFQALKKPGGVESGQVGGAAGGNDVRRDSLLEPGKGVDLNGRPFYIR